MEGGVAVLGDLVGEGEGRRQKHDVKYSAAAPQWRPTRRRLDRLRGGRLYTRRCTLSPRRSKRACSLVKHWLRED